jgi:hypothetical protein
MTEANTWIVEAGTKIQMNEYPKGPIQQGLSRTFKIKLHRLQFKGGDGNDGVLMKAVCLVSWTSKNLLMVNRVIRVG